MQMTSPAMNELVAATMVGAMMAAMMLPSIAPVVWRYHRHLRAAHATHAGRRTALFVVGYAGVWAAIGLAMFAMSTVLSPMGSTSSTDPQFSPLSAAAILLGVGALQRSRWKAKQLLRCRRESVAARALPENVMMSWLVGSRFGVDCGLSCAALMVVLFVTGLMNARVMVLIMAAITAERVGPAGPRIARLSGALAQITGLVICVRALADTIPGA